MDKVHGPVESTIRGELVGFPRRYHDHACRRQAMNMRTKGRMVVLLALGIAGISCKTTGPTPANPLTIDSVMKLPPTGLPIMVPQSLGGEFRALPESRDQARGVALDLRDFADASKIGLFVDGIRVQPGNTSSTLAAGDPPRFSVTPDSYGARLILLLPLVIGGARQRMSISIESEPGAGQQTVILDTPSASKAMRPEPSDVLFGAGTPSYYWWQPIYTGRLDEANVVAHDVLLGGWLLAAASSFTFNGDGTLPSPVPQAVHRNCRRPTGDYCEDLHYYLMLDSTFLATVYGRTDRISQ